MTLKDQEQSGVSRTNVISAFKRYFEPTQDGQVRYRDYIRESVGDLPSELKRGSSKVRGGLLSLGRSVLHETNRSIGSVLLSTSNVLNKAIGRETTPQLSSPGAELDTLDKAFKFALFGDAPLESLGTRINKSPGRLKEFLGAFNIEAEEDDLKKFSIPGVMLMTALDFTGMGGEKNAFKLIAKTNKADEVFNIVRGIFKGSDDKIVKELSETLVNITDEKVVQEIFESLGAKADNFIPPKFSLINDSEIKNAIESGEDLVSKSGREEILEPEELLKFIEKEGSGAQGVFLSSKEKESLGKFLDSVTNEENIAARGLIVGREKLPSNIGPDLVLGKINENFIVMGTKGSMAGKVRMHATPPAISGDITLGKLDNTDITSLLKRLTKDPASPIKSPVITVEDLARIKNRYKIKGTDRSITTISDGFSSGSGTADEVADAFGLGEGAVKERGFIKTARESALTSPEVRKQLAANYNVLKNKTAFESAERAIRADLDEAMRAAKDVDGFNTAEGQAAAQLLIIKSQNAGRFDDAIDIVDGIAERATRSGQANQVLSAFNRLTPDGVILFAKRQIKRGNKALNPNKRVELTEDIAKELVDQAKKASALVDGTEEKLIETAKLIKQITELIPSNTAQKIAMTQTLAQLLNPKTLIRNFMGNTGFGAVENLMDVVAVPFDSALSLITGKRSKALPSLLVQTDGWFEGLKLGAKDALLGIDTSGVPTRFDLPKTRVFRGKVGGAAETLLNLVLRAPDRAAYKASYDGAIYQQMKVAAMNGERLDGPTEAMKEVAHFDGLYRTFQDENTLTYLFTNLKKAFNVKKDFGLGDILLKYPKTPANLLSRGIQYSPAGFVETIFKASQPLIGKPFNQKAFVESFTRALIGSTGLVGTGALLNELGIISGKREENKNIANINRGTGLNEYQINASALKRFVLSGMDPEYDRLLPGDKLYSYGWFQPLAIGVAMGANINQNRGELGGNSVITTLVEGLEAGTDALGEQPLISNLTRILKFGDGLSDMGMKTLDQVPASFMPTLLNQVKQLRDNTSRNTYDPDVVRQMLHRAQQRVPGVAGSLAPSVSVFGEDQEVYQNGSNNLFNVFFNPSFASVYKPTPEAQLVLDLYDQTGLTGQAPKLVNKTQVINGEKVKLGPQTIAKLQRFTGTISRDYFHVLANSPEFQAMDSESQIKHMSGVLTSIGQAGKIVILGDQPKKNPSAMTQQIVNQYMNSFPSSTNTTQQPQAPVDNSQFNVIETPR